MTTEEIIEEFMVKVKMFYARIFLRLSKMHFAIYTDTDEVIVEEMSVLDMLKQALLEGETN